MEVDVVVWGSWLELVKCMVVWSWMSSGLWITVVVVVLVVVVVVVGHGSRQWMQLKVLVQGNVSSRP